VGSTVGWKPMIAARGEVPSTIDIDLVEAALEDLRQRRPHAESGAERGAEQVEVREYRRAVRHLEGIEPKRRDALVPERVDAEAGAEVRGEQRAIFGLRRLDDQERHAAGRRLTQDVEDGVRLAASGDAGDERVARER